jgi:hypothetical protein
LDAAGMPHKENALGAIAAATASAASPINKSVVIENRMLRKVRQVRVKVIRAMIESSQGRLERAPFLLAEPVRLGFENRLLRLGRCGPKNAQRMQRLLRLAQSLQDPVFLRVEDEFLFGKVKPTPRCLDS